MPYYQLSESREGLRHARLMSFHFDGLFNPYRRDQARVHACVYLGEFGKRHKRGVPVDDLTKPLVGYKRHAQDVTDDEGKILARRGDFVFSPEGEKIPVYPKKTLRSIEAIQAVVGERDYEERELEIDPKLFTPRVLLFHDEIPEERIRDFLVKKIQTESLYDFFSRSIFRYLESIGIIAGEIL